MIKLTKVVALPAYQLEVEYSDGIRGFVSLAERLFGPMFEPLRDPHFFAQVYLDEFGVVAWPNGADLAPDAIYRQLTAKQKAG